MSFLRRVGEGISISVVSMLFPFKHPALFLYPLLYGLVAFPSMALMVQAVGQAGGGERGMAVMVAAFLMEVVFIVIASIAFLGLIRGTIARLDGGSMKFWKAMAVDGRMLLGMFFYILIKAILMFLAPSFDTYFGADFSLAELDSGISVLFLAYVAWCALSFYFLPVICYETKNFFDAVGHSVKHFFHSWLEVVFGVFCTWIIVLVFLSAGAMVTRLDRMDFAVKMMDVVRQPLAAMAGDMFIALIMLAVALILATGTMVLLPALYHYTTHKRKNPFTTPVSRKR